MAKSDAIKREEEELAPVVSRNIRALLHRKHLEDVHKRPFERIADDDWRRLLDAVSATTPESRSPTMLLVEWMAQLREGGRPTGFSLCHR